MLPMLKEILVQVVKKPVTNLFPAARLPKTITGFLDQVKSGKAVLTPPVETPVGMRGKLVYDRSLCNGCTLCIKVCPSHAIELVTYPIPPVKEGEDKPRAEKRIRIYVANCIFCGQCTDICSKSAITQSSEFLLATEDKFAESQIIE